MENTNAINKEAWDSYQEAYFQFQLMARPDYFEFFSGGGVDWQGEDHMVEMLGDVRGLKLLDTWCASDAVQAFSWHNIGAIVTACDIAPNAVAIASNNAAKMNLAVDFVVADMQKLKPIRDQEFDVVFATYPCWVQDLQEACSNWYRVLKDGGRLLLNMSHPIMDCVDQENGGLVVTKDYNHPGATREEQFDGTGLSDRFGGWSVDLPSVCYAYRISDIVNAICDAGFVVKRVHESNNMDATEDVSEDIRNDEQLRKLPSEFTVLAVK